jgi:hypothetical protein
VVCGVFGGAQGCGSRQRRFVSQVPAFAHPIYIHILLYNRRIPDWSESADSDVAMQLQRSHHLREQIPYRKLLQTQAVRDVMEAFGRSLSTLDIRCKF